MRKKFMLLVTLMLCGLLVLASCGANSADSEEITDSGNGESTISFGLGDTVEYEGLCEMSNLYAEVLDDQAKADGWGYYYTATDENPAKTIKWELPEDCYTTVEVLFTLKNTSDKAQTFGDKIIAQLFYMENENADTDYWDGTVFQQNPGQKDENGEVVMWSTKPVEIAAGESTQVSFRFDIPKDVYDKIYATASGEDIGIVEKCEFNYGDGTTYVIDLTKTLTLASQYE